MNVDNFDLDALFAAAQSAAANAYAPYSRFRVGAALLADDGSVWRGVNVENRSYGLTICAERNAVFQAVAQSRRRFRAIAVAALDCGYPLPPCGACRQVLSEFMDKDCIVRFGGADGRIVDAAIGDLYPFDSLRELADVR